MSIFLSVVLLAYGAMHFYALGKLWQALPHTPLLATALAAWAALLLVAPFLAHGLENRQWHAAGAALSWLAYVWMGYLLLFCMAFLLFDLGHALAVLLGLQWQPAAWPALRAVALAAAALFGYGVFEARQLHVVQLTIRTPKLPPGAGVTIAQLSDLHLGLAQGEAFAARVADKLCALKPDIVAATGDIVDGRGDDLPRLAARLHACAPPRGAYAVIGNHEYYAGLDAALHFFDAAGYSVLRGQAVRVGGVVLAGVDDPALSSPPLPPGLAALPRDAFVVLLKHQPTVARDLPFDLQLSGHIHGGQIFPLGAVTWLVYRVHAGLTALDAARWLYVSRGAGTWGPPLRLFAPPEITLIRIEHGAVPAAELH